MELRPFQREGVGFLEAHPRAFLADEMGLGKSAQLIRASQGQTLVVAPAMVLDGNNWTDEINRWADDPGRFTQVAYSKLFRSGFKVPADGNGRPLPYHRAPGRWRDGIRPELDRHWDTIIYDEAHYLKGRATLRTGAGQLLADRRADRVYLATGTPIPNFAHELFTLVQMIRPEQAGVGEDLGSYWRWVQTWFSVYNAEHRGRVSREIGTMLGCSPSCARRPLSDPCEHYQRFVAANLGDLFLRRRRDDVLPDLPPLTEVEVGIKMSPKVRKAYGELKKDWATEVDGQVVVGWSQSAKHVMLDKLTTGLGLLTGQIDATADNPKLARLAEDLRGRSRPTLIFAHYHETVEACHRLATKMGLRSGLVYGPTSKAERLRVVRAFQAGELDVLVGSLETLAEGLTLVAADVVIFVEKSWKPSRNEQAVRRAHRLGQTRPVTVLDYVTQRSIDSGKRRALKEKTDHQMYTLTAAELLRLAEG